MLVGVGPRPHAEIIGPIACHIGPNPSCSRPPVVGFMEPKWATLRDLCSSSIRIENNRSLCSGARPRRGMDDLNAVSEETSFIPEDVTSIMKEVPPSPVFVSAQVASRAAEDLHSQVVENNLAHATYQHTKVPQWTHNVRRYAAVRRCALGAEACAHLCR